MGPVVAVVDGDAIDVELGEETVCLRLIGIDTPEIGRGGVDSESCLRRRSQRIPRGAALRPPDRPAADPTRADVDFCAWGYAFFVVSLRALSSADRSTFNDSLIASSSVESAVLIAVFAGMKRAAAVAWALRPAAVSSIL